MKKHLILPLLAIVLAPVWPGQAQAQDADQAAVRNAQNLYAELLARETKADPSSIQGRLQAANKQHASLLAAQPQVDRASVQGRIRSAQQRHQAAQSHRVNLVRQNIVNISVGWLDPASSTLAYVSCEGVVLFGQNRVVTHGACVKERKLHGVSFSAETVKLTFKNGVHVMYSARAVKFSGEFAYIDIKAEERKGLTGVEALAAPADKGLDSLFNNQKQILAFNDAVITVGKQLRGGYFVLDKWASPTVVGSPVFYMNKLVGFNTRSTAYNYYVKELPLFTVLNDENGGSAIVQK